MKWLKFCLVFVVVSRFYPCSGQAGSTYHNKMLAACRKYVTSYRPVYLMGSDTMVVARIGLPSDSINRFLFNCIKDSDFTPLVYAYVILTKNAMEYIEFDHQGYILGESMCVKGCDTNGFVEMARVFLKLPNPLSGITESDTALSLPILYNNYLEPLFVDELAHMLYRQRKRIANFKESKQILKHYKPYQNPLYIRSDMR